MFHWKHLYYIAVVQLTVLEKPWNTSSMFNDKGGLSCNTCVMEPKKLYGRFGPGLGVASKAINVHLSPSGLWYVYL